MRVIIDLIEKLTDAIRIVVAVLVLVPLAYGLFLTFNPPKPDASEVRSFARSAAAARQQHELVEEGWGYSATTAAVGSDGRPGAGQAPANDGWAD